MQFSRKTSIFRLLLVLCLALLPNCPAEPASTKPPKTMTIAGATGGARLDPWIVDSPSDYSGHYVSESVTDGWVEMLVKVRSAGPSSSRRWMVDIYQRDDRQGPAREDTDFKNRPLIAHADPYFQLGDNGPAMFFAQRTVRGPKGAALEPILVSDDGSCFRFEPRVPKSVVLAGKDTIATFRPWKANNPSAYAGRYVSVSPMAGSCELKITLTRHPESRLPWRIDTACSVQTPGDEDKEYSYSKRPLWTAEWPHFDAHDTYLFVEFIDPRSASARPTQALITQKGEVLLKED